MRFRYAIQIAVAALAIGAGARAEPVVIGRHAEIRIGITQRSPYAMSAGDAHRTGRTRARAPGGAPARIWNIALPHGRAVPPAILEDGTLVVGTDAGLYALDPDSGQARWFAAVGPVRFTPSLTPSGALVAIAAGKLVWIDPGGQVRTTELPALLGGAPLVLDSGTVVALGRDGSAHAVSGDGAYLASVPLSAPEQPVQWTASLGGDRILGAGAGPDLILFSLQGSNERPLHMGSHVAASPIVADDETIWVLGDHGTLSGIGRDGRSRVAVELGQGGGGLHAALGWDGALRVGLPYGELLCVGPRGEERWRRGIDAPPGAMLIDADDTTLVASARGTLYAIDHHGELRWRQALDLRSVGRPVLGSNGTLFVVARGGVVQAWR